MQKLLRKLSSRKFWMAAAGLVTGIAMAFGVETSAVSTVAGAVTAVASIFAYILAEGTVDAASVKSAAEQVLSAAKIVAECEAIDDTSSENS